MFCPNCGNDCGDAKFCSECGWDLRGVRIKNCAPEVENKRDISYYYNMYAPNKEAAIVALRADTGMSAFEAMQAINILFGEDQCADACESAQTQFPSTSKKEYFRSKRAELDATGQVYCPKCLSTNISANRKGFGIGKAIVGAAAFGGIGLTAGNIGSKKIICTCLKCGYQWKAGKK